MLKFITETSLSVLWFRHVRNHACGHLPWQKLPIFLLCVPPVTVLCLILDAMAFIGMAGFMLWVLVAGTVIWAATRCSFPDALHAFYSVEGFLKTLRKYYDVK